MHAPTDNRMNPMDGLPTIRRLSVFWACVVFIVSVLAGCAAVGPNYTPVVPKTPEKWHTELRKGLSASHLNVKNLAHWWTTLNDPELTRLVERAVYGNLTLKDAQSRLREARALRGISKAGLFPTLNAGASVTKSRGSENSGTKTEGELYAAGFDASWELDIFGGVRRAVEAAQASLRIHVHSKDPNRVGRIFSARVIELAERLELPVSEADVTLFDAYNAEEAFWTTTSYCILPISRIDGRWLTKRLSRR